jgi:hypothetical protein
VTDGHDRAGMRTGVRPAAELLALTVRLHGIALGRPVDLFLDRDDLRAVGLDVLCGDEVHRFLPLAAATLGEDAIAISSPLVLLEAAQLDFYRSRTLSLSALVGRPVRRRDQDVGLLRDLRLNADLTPATVVVEVDGRERELAFDGSIRFAPRSRSAA